MNHDEILPGLHQGGWHALEPDARRFDVVVNLSSVEYVPPPGQLYVRWPIEDGQSPDFRKLTALGRLVSRLHRSGQRVLVNCDAGLNRSGIVMAFALMESGYSADAAISLIREKRDEFALCNSGFELAIRRAEW